MRGQNQLSTKTPEQPALLKGGLQQLKRQGSNLDSTSQGKMTRIQCTHHFTNIKRMCKPYDCSTHKKGFVKLQTAQLSLNVAGRLSYFLYNWKALTTDKWVLETVQGLRIPFLNPPVQRNYPNPPTVCTPKAKPLDTGRGGCPAREGSGGQSTRPSTSRKFLLNSLPCPQERWPDEAGHQPQEVS